MWPILGIISLILFIALFFVDVKSESPVQKSSPIPIKKQPEMWTMEYKLRDIQLGEEYKTFVAEMAKKKKVKIGSGLTWFITDWGRASIPSPAEMKIMEELKLYRIQWEREVSFNLLPTPNGSFYRFDFYLPEHNILIEYQGKIWHSSDESIDKDRIKAKFCKKHNIRLITLDRRDYYRLGAIIGSLMNDLYIKRK